MGWTLHEDSPIEAWNQAPREMQSKMGLYNELGKKTQMAIPNSILVEPDHIGHLPHIESFDRFMGPLLEFLKSNGLQRPCFGIGFRRMGEDPCIAQGQINWEQYFSNSIQLAPNCTFAAALCP